MTRPLGLISVAGFLLLTACATDGAPAPGKSAATTAAPRPAATDSAFRTSDFAWSTAPGTGAIQGQVTYSPRKAAYTCSGVVLTPETPWVRQRMNILYKSADSATLPAEEVRRRTPPERSQDYSGFVRRTSCDAAGKFAFSNLPDGSWFVITVVKPIAGATGSEMAVMRRVSVKNGKPVSLKL